MELFATNEFKVTENEICTKKAFLVDLLAQVKDEMAKFEEEECFELKFKIKKSANGGEYKLIMDDVDVEPVDEMGDDVQKDPIKSGKKKLEAVGATTRGKRQRIHR